MSHVTQTITLTSNQHYSCCPFPQAVGHVLTSFLQSFANPSRWLSGGGSITGGPSPALVESSRRYSVR